MTAGHAKLDSKTKLMILLPKERRKEGDEEGGVKHTHMKSSSHRTLPLCREWHEAEYHESGLVIWV